MKALIIRKFQKTLERTLMYEPRRWGKKEGVTVGIRVMNDVIENKLNRMTAISLYPERNINNLKMQML